MDTMEQIASKTGCATFTLNAEGTEQILDDCVFKRYINQFPEIKSVEDVANGPTWEKSGAAIIRLLYTDISFENDVEAAWSSAGVKLSRFFKNCREFSELQTEQEKAKKKNLSEDSHLPVGYVHDASQKYQVKYNIKVQNSMIPSSKVWKKVIGMSVRL